MDKQLKTAFCLSTAISMIMVAWNGLSGVLFGGSSSVALAGMVVCLGLFVFLFATNSTVRARTKDLLILNSACAGLEWLEFLARDFEWFGVGYDDWGNPNGALKFFNVLQYTLIVLGILLFAYIVFRAICEVNGHKIGLVEGILGNKENSAHTKKQRAPKEFANVGLEDKPVNKKAESEETATSPKQEGEE